MSDSYLEKANAAFQEDIEKWHKYLGIPDMASQSETEEILLMTRKDFRNKNNIELAEFAVMLCQHSMFLQKEENKCKAFMRWAEQISKIITDQNDKTRLSRWMKNISMRQQTVSFMSRKADLLSDSVTNLAKARSFERRNNESA